MLGGLVNLEGLAGWEFGNNYLNIDMLSPPVFIRPRIKSYKISEGYCQNISYLICLKNFGIKCQTRFSEQMIQSMRCNVNRSSLVGVQLGKGVGLGAP